MYTVKYLTENDLLCIINTEGACPQCSNIVYNFFVSVYFKAYQANSEISQRITLPLAERMVEKYISEDKIDAEQEIQLYLMILNMQVHFKSTETSISNNY